MKRRDYCIKEGYRARAAAARFEGPVEGTGHLADRPDLYLFAREIGRRFGCDRILAVGCGRAQGLAAVGTEFAVTGVDVGPNIEWCRKHHQFGKWIKHDLETVLPTFSPSELARTVVMCPEVIERLTNPEPLLSSLRRLLEHAPVALLSTPDRDRVRGPDDMGPPADAAHVREWNRNELQALLADDFGFALGFLGLTRSSRGDDKKDTQLAVLHRNDMPAVGPSAPAGFNVVAFMTAYNEADIIHASITRLAEQGVKVYLIDNWSDDGTFEIASGSLRHLLAGLERFPPDGPARYYEWHRLLTRVEELAMTVDATWCIHHDVDEIRESCWPNASLRDALYHVDRLGFNAVDHTVVNFHPVDDGFVPGSRFEDYFRYWDFGTRAGHFLQIKAWKKSAQRVMLAESGGHAVEFPGRRVFPYKFLLRHYPVRSSAQGQKKIFAERQSRYSPDERRTRRWHIQYDHLKPGADLLRSADDLNSFDPETFYDEYLVERLSGINIPRAGDGQQQSGPGLSSPRPSIRTRVARLVKRWISQG
jgi:SAM-dependent methyltransferase